MKFLNRKIFFLCLCFFSATALHAQQAGQAIANEFLVLLNTGDDMQKILESGNLSSQFSIERKISVSPNIYLLHSSSVNDNASLELLKKTKGIILAQKNHETELRAVVPNDTIFASQWNMNNTGQTGGTPDADIDALEAWGITTGGLTVQGDTIVVAVIDCGADLTHEDLNFWKNYMEIPGNSIDDDTNGYVDDFDGWNAQTQTGTISSCNHGTHVSGIIGAIGNNTTGVVGVNWNVKIMPVQPSSMNEAFVVGAYTYVYTMRKLYNQTNGAKGAFVVATNSSFGVNFGQPANYPLWCAMYDSLGSVGILNAGAGPNLNIDVDAQGDIPTACASDWLISVTNTNSSDALNGSAGYGDTTMDLGAPGTAILSTYPGNSYNVLTGTSMATPHVAGAVALMWAAACTELVDAYRSNPAATALIMKQLLLDSVDTLPSLSGITVSNGRLNLYKALLAVQNYCLTISVDEKQESSGAYIYPNPADNQFTIYNLRSTISKIEVYNVFGQQVFSLRQTTNDKQQTINTTTWSRGVYFVKYFSGNKFYCSKIILN
jgi:subtilisin family serine protease